MVPGAGRRAELWQAASRLKVRLDEAPGPDDPNPTATSAAMTGARLVPVCRTIPSRRIAFGGAVLFIALSVAAVPLWHWQRRSEERRVRARLSELGNHLLKDIAVTPADPIFRKVATLARLHQ